MASERAVLYGYVTLSIVVLLTTSGTPVLQKKGFIFQKICFKISSDSHIKKRQYQKCLVLFFRRTFLLTLK